MNAKKIEIIKFDRIFIFKIYDFLARSFEVGKSAGANYITICFF